MNNPQAIIVQCDGAMDYDRKQTGGNGFYIRFPESIDHDEILISMRNDSQGIHRLEAISIIEAMKILLALNKKGEIQLRLAAGVEIYTDRLSVAEMSDPYRLQGYRSNGWKTHEGKPIKDKELWDELDKTRKKLATQVGGRVEIGYKREKQNTVADKLSKLGKKGIQSRRVKKKLKNVASRMFDGPDVDHSSISEGDIFNVHIYAWESVQNEVEISSEAIDGPHIGKIITIYVSPEQKSLIHRKHKYQVVTKKVFKHHITISSSTEL